MHDKAAVRYSRTSERVHCKTRKSTAQENPRHSAKAYAVWLLSKREYSAATLRNKLLTRGYDAEETAAAMQFLQENNYQSDTRYAAMKARSTAHRAGDWKISRQLGQKGIAEDLAKEQIAELPPEEERAAQAAKTKFLQQLIEDGMSPELKQKIWRYLGYRGFSSHAIRHALTCLLHEAHA